MLGRCPAAHLLARSGARASGGGALRACFASHVAACEQDAWFGASVPLEKVLAPDGDALLAYKVRAFSRARATSVLSACGR